MLPQGNNSQTVTCIAVKYTPRYTTIYLLALLRELALDVCYRRCKLLCFRKYANSTAHERETVRSFTAVQQFISDFLGVLKRMSDHRRYYPPRTNTCRECTSSQRPPSLKEQHPLREQGRLRAGILMHESTDRERKTELYEVLRFSIIAVQQD